MNISIITPSYNQAEFIERTIQSVLSQDIPNLEYTIIDGKSTDHTVDILKKYQSQIKWISEKDNGQTEAVNKGFKSTSNEIIGWLNSDDIYYPHALKTVQDFFIQHPEIDIVYGNANHIDVNDTILEPYYTESWNIERLKEVCYLCQPAVFFRRNLIHRFGFLNENLQYCMDYEYWLRIACAGVKFTYLPILLAGSRLHADTKTLGSRVKVHREINDMLKNIFQRVPDRWLSNYAHALIESSPRKVANQKRAVAIQTIKASLYWNKGISKSLFKLCLAWATESFRKIKI